MKSLFIQITLFISFLLFLLIGIYGTITPNRLITQSVGIMQMGVFDTGLALHQGNRGIFYPVTPFNDYLIYNNNERSTLITSDEISTKKYTSSYEKSHFENILTAVQTNFFPIPPFINFSTDQLDIQYKTSINENKAVITRIITPKQNNKPILQAMTLPYRGGDFVFDTTGQMYYFHLEEDKERFEKIYNISLSQDNFELIIDLEQNPILIINPSLTGAIVITPEENQKLLVNKNTKMIQLEQNVTEETIIMNMNIEIYNNPEEAINTLKVNTQ